MSAEELRESWQGRALAFSKEHSRNQLCAALLSLLADNYDDTMPFLLAAVFDGCAGIRAPFYCSNPRIDKSGRIVADMITRHGQRKKDTVIFKDEAQLQAIFRKLADKLNLFDLERIDLFMAVRHWIKADQRLDPAFDRRDPDAKRMVLH